MRAWLSAGLVVLSGCAWSASSELFCDDLCLLAQPIKTTGSGNDAVGPTSGDGGSDTGDEGGGGSSGSGGRGGAEPTGCMSDADCYDPNPCKAAKCGANHACYAVEPANFNDWNACTADVCDPRLGIGVVHTPIEGIDDHDPCTTDACNRETGEITHTPIDGCHPN